VEGKGTQSRVWERTTTKKGFPEPINAIEAKLSLALSEFELFVMECMILMEKKSSAMEKRILMGIE
jgi:hypothetical protein